VRVKFCGITNLEDAECAVEVGAWAIGLNHWPGSPRRVDPEAASEIAAAVRRRIELVGVFVNQPLDEIARAVEDEHLTMVQLHGDEGLSFCNEVARRTGAKVIKALRVRSTADVEAARAYRTDFHLFDAYTPAAPGGTGESFDWELVGQRTTKVPAILAGGLRPDNVAEAIAVARPFAVDVASGIERAPGRKDHNLMADFVRRARAAAQSLAGAPR
jgi:phosphoribosylanthranilate isomerase